VHDVLRRWRRLADGQDEPRVLVGESWVFDLGAWARFYGSGEDELHLAFNFPFMLSPFEAPSLRGIVERSEAALAPHAWPVWAGSNHDGGRFPSRWCGGDQRLTRCALVMLLGLRGTAFLYYGDELGMADVHVPPDRRRDPAGASGGTEGRDPCRTPMPWSPGRGFGFTDPGVEAWLPFGRHAGWTVEEQRADPGSPLHLCRDLIALRRGSPDLRAGAYRSLPSPPGTWAWRRGHGTAVALNLREDEQRFDGLGGRVLLRSDRLEEGDEVRPPLTLPGRTAAVLSTTAAL
jgi:alpha-glucosidase